jgi:type IV pilus assembly protein PilB
VFNKRQQQGSVLAIKENLLFGDWLIQQGCITEEQLQFALEDQKENGGRIGQALVRLKTLPDNELTMQLADYLDFEYVSLADFSTIDKDVARSIPENIAKRFCVLAIDEQEDQVVIAMSDPLNVIAVDTVSVKLKRPIKTVLASEGEVQKAIEYVYHGTDVEEQQIRDLVELEISTDDDDMLENALEMDTSMTAEAEEAPVIRFVDLMLSQAIKSRASDIHVEPQDKTMSIRMRIDGMLTEMVPPARKMQAAVLARIKICLKWILPNAVFHRMADLRLNAVAEKKTLMFVSLRCRQFMAKRS